MVRILASVFTGWVLLVGGLFFVHKFVPTNTEPPPLQAQSQVEMPIVSDVKADVQTTSPRTTTTEEATTSGDISH